MFIQCCPEGLTQALPQENRIFQDPGSSLVSWETQSQVLHEDSRWVQPCPQDPSPEGRFYPNQCGFGEMLTWTTAKIAETEEELTIVKLKARSQVEYTKIGNLQESIQRTWYANIYFHCCYCLPIYFSTKKLKWSKRSDEWPHWSQIQLYQKRSECGAVQIHKRFGIPIHSNCSTGVKAWT